MKAKMTVLFAMIMLFETAGLAQNRFEIFGDYSYLHFNPTVTGINSRSFNGGGGGLTLYFLGIFGIKADFMAYGSTTFSKTFPSAVISPGGGFIPAGTYTSQGDMFTYMAGPVIRIPIPGCEAFRRNSFRRIEHERLRKPDELNHRRRWHNLPSTYTASIHHGCWRWTRYFGFEESFHPARRSGLCLVAIFEPIDKHQ
jgi:hypothetical protein